MELEWRSSGISWCSFTESRGRKARLEYTKVPGRPEGWTLSVKFNPRINPGWGREYDVEVIWPARNCPDEPEALRIAEEILCQEWPDLAVEPAK